MLLSTASREEKERGNCQTGGRGEGSEVLVVNKYMACIEDDLIFHSFSEENEQVVLLLAGYKSWRNRAVTHKCLDPSNVIFT